MAGHDHARHQVSFVLDKSVMFHVISSRNGQKHEHRIKALDIIWQKVRCSYDLAPPVAAAM